MFNEATMREYNTTRERRVHFASVYDWVCYLESEYETTSDAIKYQVNRYMHRTEYADGWAGEYSGATCIDMFKRGLVPDGFLEAVNKSLADLPPITSSFDAVEAITTEYNESGFMVDMQSYLNGEDFSMVDVLHNQTTKPVVWLGVSVGGNANVTADSLKNRGIALVRAIQTLESRDIPVGVMAYDRSVHCDGIRNNHLQTIVVKNPQDDMNIARVCMMFGNASAFRTLCFSTEALHNKISTGNIGGVGSVTYAKDETDFNERMSGYSARHVGVGLKCNDERDPMYRSFVQSDRMIVLDARANVNYSDCATATADLVGMIQDKADEQLAA